MTYAQQPPAGVPVCYRHPGREAHIRCQRCDRPICPDCMASASVGFHCPDCVAAGRASTPKRRWSLGSASGTAPIATITLIVLNALVWLATIPTGGNDSPVVRWLALRPAGFCLPPNSMFGALGHALNCPSGTTAYPGVSDGAYWQLITSGFVHVAPLHILFNCFFIYVVGSQLEAVLGRARYLALYFVSLLAGSAMVYWASAPHGETLGASGAAFGLMAALLVIALRLRANVTQILVMIAINVIFTISAPDISWQGHLGGFLGGAAAAALLVLIPGGRRRTPLQLGGFGALVVVILALIIARSATLL